ncbi:hypothetical protein DEAC_c17100 [Desulfosporosinus acididurans]|uniref:Mu-like prophage I protein n=1 Tax=Desulfosporosinus acididurans TaxID=476652 RepID=A0A0J1INR3_9FIRM|nr:phage protease [Desulfosporosinus acididurans]KLU66311.1 hypothetical protein DEAC_c17100 [Desulfosporosinus acididurans]
MLWSKEYVDKLPDSSFAHISPGGKKDSEGKTTPRSLRHLPYKDSDGKPNEAHVKDALARLDQTQIPASAKEEAFGKLKGAAKELGVGVDTTRKFSDMRPMKIPVGRIGEWKHPKYGVLKMSQQTFDDMVRNFKDKTIGRDPFVRIGHNKGTGDTWGDVPSEGWIQDLQQEGDVLYALADPTNPQVVEAVRNGRFKYASPEYEENYQSKEDGSFKGAVLLALALTNEPFLTHLPEARALADPPDTFYLDYEEVKPKMGEEMKDLLDQQKETNGFLRKLADFFTGKKPEDVTPPAGGIPAAATPPTQTAEQVKLAEMQFQLATTQFQLRTAEVERRLAEYTAKGIPPAVLEQYRLILLSDNGEKVIKLADEKGAEKTVSVSEQIYASLDAFPEASRIKLSQVGEQTTPPPADSPEAVKKLADETMTELGYSVDEKGHYKLA